ncbi:MAG: DUF2807 domain-containing protein [Alistipes sp.]|jgi:hypothetical protein|nr:DUF2807 domain-containing protein [Alistipes sp.]
MKNLFIALIAAAVMTPAVGMAQRVSSRVHFEGERITGVTASSAFDVVLVRSLQTKATVEINSDMERYVRISRSSDGVVSVGLHDVPNNMWRTFNRLTGRDKVMRLTLHLPALATVRLSGASDLRTEDTFSGESVDIQLSGASEINGSLALSAEKVKLQCSGASNADLTLDGTRELTVVASGASDVKITARSLDYSKFGASGASDVTIEGTGGTGDWTASGASEIHADRFAARDVSIVVSGASSARVNASGTLTTRTGGASSVRYVGRPGRLNNTSEDVRPL